MLYQVIIVLHILLGLGIIGLVLMQQGKGADMCSSFGGGSAGSLFGATGAANFLSRATKWAAVVFFITTIALAYVSNRGSKGQDTGVMQNFTPTAPAAPAAAKDAAVPSLPGAASVSGSAPIPVAPATPAMPAVPAAPVSK